MLINRKIGNYVLLCRLAVGGQSEVFLAMKSGPGDYTRPVVIKALPSRYRKDPKFVELFHREAFLSSRFSHPNVVTVHDARILEGEQCMIMDFISGQTVADIAQRGYKAGSPPSTQQAVRIIADACDGLHYAHDFRALDDTEYNVVHRDVSPQNLMVTYQGVTIVFDFGIAKIEGKSSSTDTLAGGKYAYMSPEQCLGDDVDTRSDIFSLGVILYELTVGTRLFRRSSKDAVVKAVTEEEIKPPGALRSKFPPMLEDIIMKALERDADRRYQTAGEMRDDLRDYLAVQGGTQGRSALGNYVAGLFEEERAGIAEIIQTAREMDEEPKPKNGIPLEKLGWEDELEEEDGPEVPMPEPESDEELAEQVNEASEDASDAEESVREPSEPEEPDETGESADPGESEAEADDETRRRGAEVAAARRELESLKKRHTVLLVVLAVIVLILLGLSVASLVQGPGGFGQSEPVEIGTSSGE